MLTFTTSLDLINEKDKIEHATTNLFIYLLTGAGFLRQYVPYHQLVDGILSLVPELCNLITFSMMGTILPHPVWMSGLDAGGQCFIVFTSSLCISLGTIYV